MKICVMSPGPWHENLAQLMETDKSARKATAGNPQGFEKSVAAGEAAG
jgi:hypothetical protein